MGKCKFSDGWLDTPKYKAWLVKELKWTKKAKCQLYVKSFEISNMGEAAIVSHMLGQKHRRLVAASSTHSLRTFLAQSQTRMEPRPTTSSHEITNTPIDQW